MANYQHILLAIDFSTNIHAVAEKALSLANKHQAKLSIIHVLDNIAMPDMNYGTVISLNEKTDNELLEAEKTKLITLAQHLNISHENCWLIWGVPKQEIIEMAKQQQVDLIILGSHHRHGLALLLGSTAHAVLHHAPCDVLAVRL